MVRVERIFLKTDSRKSKTIDAIIKSKDNGKIKYKATKHSEINYIIESQTGSYIEYDDGSTEDIDVRHTLSKVCDNEVYIIGGPSYCTETEVYVKGEYSEKASLPKFKSKTLVRVNDCIVRGEAELDNSWDWEVIDKGTANFISIDNGFGDLHSDKNVVKVGFDEEINTLELSQSLI